METFYLILGVFLLLLVMFDFFYTTLSGSGAGFISESVSNIGHTTISWFVHFFGRGMYRYSGLLVNFLVAATWMLMVWMALFLVFSSNPEAIVNSDGRMADNYERLYFTGYTLSTLGMGNFNPTTGFFEILTSSFSFFGFIFFTSSMTYFLSVSSAVINKRTLARSIYNLGNSPEKIVQKFLDLDASYCYNQFLVLQEMIDRHAVNHLAYPVVHFYSHPNRDVCLSLNITRLDEAVTILLNSEKGEELQNELRPLRSSLTHFLDYINTNFSSSLPKNKNDDSTPLPLPYDVIATDKSDLEHRRVILGGLLRSENFEWEDVNPVSLEKP